MTPRPGLNIHVIGSQGDAQDAWADFRNAYGTEGDWVLVRPDGYIGAIVATDRIETLERYFRNVGLEDRAHA